MGKYRKLELHFLRRKRKDGQLGGWQEYYVWFTPLFTCQHCGKFSTPKRVQYRSLIDKTLCMGCWNRYKPIALAERDYLEIRYTINKTRREIGKCRKSKLLAN